MALTKISFFPLEKCYEDLKDHKQKLCKQKIGLENYEKLKELFDKICCVDLPMTLKAHHRYDSCCRFIALCHGWTPKYTKTTKINFDELIELFNECLKICNCPCVVYYITQLVKEEARPSPWDSTSPQVSYYQQ
jgi:hypothetical protein